MSWRPRLWRLTRLTRSRSGVLLATQAPPRVRHAPSVRRSAWEDVADLSASFGVTLDEWQEVVLQAAMGERADGTWAAPQVAVSAPRQNGKSQLIVARALAGVLVFDERTIIVSAHQQDTAREVFTKIVDILEDNPRLNARVDSYGKALNREYIRFKTGQVIRFKARSAGGGRGFSCDCLLLDEAQILSSAAWSAILPTMSARPNPQAWLFGTPPTENDDGEVFARFRQIGLRRSSPRVAYLEWSAEAGDDFDDPAVWAKANPAFGSRITHERVADERATMDDRQFGMERLGMWAGSETRSVIDAQTWIGLLDHESQPVDHLAMAVDMAPDGESAAIGVAGRRADDRWHVELIEQRAGTLWVPQRVEEVVKRHGFGAVVVDGASPAVALVEPLQARGIEVTVTGPRDMGQACGSFLRLVMEDGIRHVGQPQLATAVSVARKRAIGTEGLWGWGRAVSSADISPVVVVTLALWGAMSSKARPQKRQRSGKAVFRG